ncbi:MAG: PHP domain-containing protein [Lachnospiraceae bacterium]
MAVDLHTHSCCSDGSLTPSELMELAYEKKLSAIALTDHDTVSGIKEAKKVSRRSVYYINSRN